jgi:hypothetical protein
MQFEILWDFSVVCLNSPVIGEPLPVSGQEQKEIEQQFMLGEDGPETVMQKAMLDAGEVSADPAKPLGHKGMFADHDAPPAANYAWAASKKLSRLSWRQSSYRAVIGEILTINASFFATFLPAKGTRKYIPGFTS